MFSKLFKYEIKSVMRIFLLAWGTLLILALINGFAASVDTIAEWINGGEIFYLIVTMAFIGVFIAIFVLNIFVIITRFYKGLLKEEGYLMFTLPVTARQLITSKALVATVITAISGVVALLAMFLCVLPSTGFGEMSYLQARLSLYLGQIDGLGWYALEIIILYIVMLMTTIYQVYASVAIGHLSSKYKVACSFGAYIGISMVVSLLERLSTNVTSGFGLFDNPTDMFSLLDANALHFAMIGIIVIQVIEIIAFHVITEWILTKRLNLE